MKLYRTYIYKAKPVTRIGGVALNKLFEDFHALVERYLFLMKKSDSTDYQTISKLIDERQYGLRAMTRDLAFRYAVKCKTENIKPNKDEVWIKLIDAVLIDFQEMRCEIWPNYTHRVKCRIFGRPDFKSAATRELFLDKVRLIRDDDYKLYLIAKFSRATFPAKSDYIRFAGLYIDDRAIALSIISRLGVNLGSVVIENQKNTQNEKTLFFKIGKLLSQYCLSQKPLMVISNNVNGRNARLLEKIREKLELDEILLSTIDIDTDQLELCPRCSTRVKSTNSLFECERCGLTDQTDRIKSINLALLGFSTQQGRDLSVINFPKFRKIKPTSRSFVVRPVEEILHTMYVI